MPVTDALQASKAAAEKNARDLLETALDALAGIKVEILTTFSGDDLREQFLLAMRSLTVWVVLGDGVMSFPESDAIDQIFWLEQMLVDNFGLTHAFVSSPNVEGAQKFVLHTIEALRDHLISQGDSLPADANPIFVAAGAVFGSALSADAEDHGELRRMTSILERFREAARRPGSTSAA